MNDAPDPHVPAAAPADPLPASEPYAFPWPPPAGGSILDALVTTWRGAVLHPVRLFRGMPPRANAGPALLYYLVIGILASGVELFWTMLLPGPAGGLFTDALGVGGPASPLSEFLLSPVMLLFSILLSAGVTHLLVIALVPGNEGFVATLRIFAFAYSPALFVVVPRVGAIVGFFWMTALSVVGVREVHGTSTARALLAVLVPVLIAGLFLAMAVLLARSGLLLAAS